MIEDGRVWRKSSHSGGNSGACVELSWRKSSHSGGDSGACVEIARPDDAFGVRDSKNASGPVLSLGVEQGVALLDAVRGDKFRR